MHVVWLLLTRLGEAQILLPAMALMLLRLGFHAPARPMAWRWVVGTLLAAGLTTATKVAFIGFGVGFAPLDFSGLSGHAMFSASVLPLLLALMLGERQAALRWRHLLPGAALALLVAISRVRIGAHSWSEVVLGAALGAAVSLWVLAVPGGAKKPPPPPQLAVGLLAGWLLALPFAAPPSRSHDLVTAVSLRVSGHDRPYTREQMRREYGWHGIRGVFARLSVLRGP